MIDIVALFWTVVTFLMLITVLARIDNAETSRQAAHVHAFVVALFALTVVGFTTCQVIAILG